MEKEKIEIRIKTEGNTSNPRTTVEFDDSEFMKVGGTFIDKETIDIDDTKYLRADDYGDIRLSPWRIKQEINRRIRGIDESDPCCVQNRVEEIIEDVIDEVREEVKSVKKKVCTFKVEKTFKINEINEINEKDNEDNKDEDEIMALFHAAHMYA